MSRRDDRDRDRYRDRDRDYDSRRHRSRFDREPSPKRSRRDGKPVTERGPSNNDLDGRGHKDRDDRKQGRGLKDALPLEPQSAASVPKGDTVDVSKEPDKKHESKSNGGLDESKRSSAPTEVPRSRSHLQHDDRGNAGQVGRNFGHKASKDRSWNNSKDTRNGRPFQKATNDTQQKEEKSKAKVDEDGVWSHDEFLKLESDPTLPPPPPLPPSLASKRPAFREKKAPLESENPEKTTMEPSKPRFHDRPAQRGRDSRIFRRPEKPFSEDRQRPYRERYGVNGGGRDGFSSRERYGVNGGGSNNGNGGDRLGRQGHQKSDTFTEKWKHDLYDEANASPPPKNEEDQIAKVEALLAL